MFNICVGQKSPKKSFKNHSDLQSLLVIIRLVLGFRSLLESSTRLKVSERTAFDFANEGAGEQTLCRWSIWRINRSSWRGCTCSCCGYCKLVACQEAGCLLHVLWAALYMWHLPLVKYRRRFVRIQTLQFFMAAELRYIISSNICIQKTTNGCFPDWVICHIPL